jgi:hypothetical protein
MEYNYLFDDNTSMYLFFLYRFTATFHDNGNVIHGWHDYFYLIV